VLGAVDKYEKMGDDAFKGYAEQFGPLDAATAKDKVLAFLQIKSLAALEQTLAPLGGEKLRAARRLAQAARQSRGDGLERFVEVDLGVVRGLAYYTGFVFEAFDRKGELRALAGGGRYDDLVGKLGGPSCRRWALRSAT
jgi:histidyl-tRNA synthetase